MIVLEGWRSPGRGVHEKLHSQMYGIINYLKDADKIGSDVWAPSLQEKIGSTIEVNEASTVRHIIGFMKSVGLIYDDALEAGKVPNSKYCITSSGEVLLSLIKMEMIALNNEDKSLIEQISNLIRRFYANAFIYWYVRDSKVHVARTVLKAINKYGYLDKVEWFILNTFITETDNTKQEEMAYKYIADYRDGHITLTTENVKKRINSYNYWTQLLNFAGLIKKVNNQLLMSSRFPELNEAILADDFLKNLNTKDRYNLEI